MAFEINEVGRRNEVLASVQNKRPDQGQSETVLDAVKALVAQAMPSETNPNNGFEVRAVSALDGTLHLSIRRRTLAPRGGPG